MPNTGKSTLLNALLGAICLPSSNVPETARITRIIHTPLEDGKQPELTYQPSGSLDKRTIVGEYGIRKSLLLSGYIHCIFRHNPSTTHAPSFTEKQCKSLIIL